MEQKTSYQIYFAWSASSFKGSTAPTIVFIPSSDKWNDFSQRTIFECKVLGAGKRNTFSTTVHLAFLGEEESPVEHVRTLLGKSSQIDSSSLPAFFTMLSDLDAYRRAVSELTRSEALRVLLAINDLVALKTKKLPKWFSQAMASDAFKFSFMRKTQTFFAFHNGSSILQGEEHRVEGGMSKYLRLTFQLPTFENPHELEFEFEPEGKISKRMAVVIGKNGVGKSQALSNLAKSLIRDNQQLRTYDEGRPVVNRLIAISGPGETRTTFPTTRVKSHIPYRRVALDVTRSPANDSGLGQVLIRLARSGERVRGQDRWNLFCSAVSAVLNLDEIFVRRLPNQALRSRKKLTKSTVALSDFRPGSEQARLALWGSIDATAPLCRFIDGEIVPLSSGESTFVRFAAQACLFIENGTLLLFDEPETHLHPNLITQFVGLLDELLKITSSFAVLATHSAYFVREVPRSQVVILKKVNNRIEIVPPRLKTLGADIGAISFFVFGDDLYGRLLEELGKRLGRSRKHPDELLGQLDDELSDEAIMYLRRELSK